MTIFRDKTFSSVLSGHFIVDLLNGSRSVIFAFLSIPLGLTNTALGVFAMLYQTASAITQPLFGYLSDRFGARWVATGGILWIGIFYSLAMISPGRLAIYLLIIGSIGSGAFHPVGAAQATLTGRHRLAGQEATTASYFFLFGQMGFFFGPILAGVILERFGLPGMLVLSVFVLPVGLFNATSLSMTSKEAGTKDVPSAATANRSDLKTTSTAVLVALIVSAASQAWLEQSIIVFLPKYLGDLGKPAAIYGLVLALFMGFSAAGNVIGGKLGDRFGKPQVIILGMFLSAVPLALIPLAGMTVWMLVLVALAGAFTGSAYSVTVVLAQRIFPGGMALASGLILGFIFSSGALGLLPSGAIADQYGVTSVFYLCSILAVISAGAAFALFERRAVPSLFSAEK